MTRVLYGLLMVAIIVTMDLLFFRGSSWVWARLAANLGVVLLFGALYFRLFRTR